MTAQPHEPFGRDHFVAWELSQEEKHEYVDGHVFAFAGGTLRHAHIAALLIEKVAPGIRPCRTLGSDVLIEMAYSFRYADLVVTCDERDQMDARSLRFPKLIIEVLSESTAKEDLGPKMREYQAIETLEEYVTIDSRKRWAQITRRDNYRWILELPVTEGVLDLRTVGVAIDLDEIYATASIS